MGLSMALEGSAMTTRDELKAALRLSDASLDDKVDNLACIYEKYNEKTTPKLTTAMKIFGEKTLGFRQEFLDETALYANNKLDAVDFVNHAEESRRKINTWVSQKTAGRIEELFSGGSITSLTKLVFASVLYFKGEWATPFTRNSSSEFFIANYSSHVPIQLMSEEMVVRYIFDVSTNLYFVELPYKSETSDLKVSMILVLDYDNPGFENAEQRLTERGTETAITKLLKEKPRKVKILLPIFDIRASYDLIQHLQALGINSLFNPMTADLSRMTQEYQNLYVSTAMHKTFLSLNKQGTEAAGAFGAGFSTLTLPFELRFDKPFHLFIYEQQTRNVLFMGRIANPNL